MKKRNVTAAVEMALFAKYAQTKDIDTRNEIVCNNTGLVKSLARKFIVDGVEYDDLVEEGIVGLIKAVEKYDPDLGYKFSTYAVNWIKHYIAKHIAEKGYSFRLPAKANENLVKLMKIKREFEDEYGFTPSVEELAEMTGLTTDNINLYLSASNKAASLNQLICDDTELGDAIKDDVPSLEETFEIADRDDKLHEVVNTCLDNRERYIVIHSFGLFGLDEMKVSDIGKELGIASKDVSKIKAKALGKLRYELTKSGYGRGYAA